MRHRPSLVSWNLTRKCNLACPHCYLDAGKSTGRELTTQECFSLLDEMVELGTEMLILTGGEPLLRKDIHEIARRASEQGLWVVMGTNGVLVTDAVAQTMVACGVKGVGISIDSIDPERHDAFRGGKNAWRHSVRALETCRANGLEVLVQTTIMEENHDEIEALLELARDRGAWSFNCYFLVQTGRGETMHELGAERTEAMLAKLVDWQQAYRPMLVRAKCAPHAKRIAFEQGLAGLDSGGCMAATEYCRITPEGDVTPCPYMTAVAGNVLERPFTEIWHEAELLRSLRDPDLLGGRCGDCEYRQLCGGCRCRAYAATGDVLAEDPACTYRPTGDDILALGEVRWTAEARQRLEKIPIPFIRRKVEKALLAHAARHDLQEITPDVFKEAIAGDGRKAPPWVRR